MFKGEEFNQIKQAAKRIANIFLPYIVEELCDLLFGKEAAV